MDVMVAGALAADISCDYDPLSGFADSPSPTMHTSNPAIFSHSAGGVAHNVALAAHYVGASTLLASVVADDIAGLSLLSTLEKSGLSTNGIRVLRSSVGARTAQYVAINDMKKDLVLAMADMAILSHSSLEADDTWTTLLSQHKPKWLVVDANWSTSILSNILAAAKTANTNIAFEPVSVQKSSKLFSDRNLFSAESVLPRHTINLAAPNAIELEMMYKMARQSTLFESERWWEIIDGLNLSSAGSKDKLVAITNAQLVDQGIPQQTIQLMPYIPSMVTKLGPQGCLLTQLLRPDDSRLGSPNYAPYILGRTTNGHATVGGLYMQLFAPAEVVAQEEVTSTNGIGDTMLGVLVAGLSKGISITDMIPFAQRAAVQTMKSAAAVSPEVGNLRDVIASL